MPDAPGEKRKLRRTAAPHGTPTSIEFEGSVWRVGVAWHQCIPVNSHVLAAWDWRPPRVALTSRTGESSP